MTDIVVQSELKPVSFEKNKGLTKSQQIIYDILVKKATIGDILTSNEIIDMYLSVEKRWNCVWSIEGGRGRQRYQATSITELTNNSYGVKTRAMQWFKNNLATCIIKGKILAIPVIEDK